MKDYFLKLKSPAYNWGNASPIGAGSIGAMLFGGIETERLCLNEETIWNGGKIDTNIPEYLDKLNTIRKMLFEGKNVEAEAWAVENIEKKHRYFVDSYEFAGDLFVDVHGYGEYESYERHLDLKRGLYSLDYMLDGVRYTRESFASHPAKLVCMRMDTDPDRRVYVKYRRKYCVKRNVSYEDGSALMDFVCTTANGAHKFRVTVKILTDGQTDTDDYDIIIDNSTRIDLFVSIVTEYRDPEMDTEKYLAFADKGYDALREEHIADFSAIMGRSDINFGDDGVDDLSASKRLVRLKNDKNAVDRGLLGLYFQFGKYLLTSSSREDTFPANLQGLWCEGYESPWNADYHTNINLQMNYWHAETANISECTLGLFKYMNECLLPGGRRVARENYHARGCVIHHISDIYEFCVATGSMWGFWFIGAGWLALHMWEHYLYTRDEKFLRETAYEFIRDAALFLADFMFEGPDGVLYSGPSASPENQYLAEHNGHKVPVYLSLSPTMDIQIISSALDIYTQVEDILEISPETADEIRAVRARMPKLQIGKYGQLQEWIEDWEDAEPGHRHISHAYGLYPEAQITRSTPELFHAIKTSLDRRLAHGGGHTGWSRAWLINLFARLKNGRDTYDNIRALFTHSTLYNLFDNHPPFQIDGNFGGAAGIAEMVLQSHEGFISLIPAICEELKDGSFEGLRARGGYAVSAKWADLKVTEFEITGTDGEVTVELAENQTDVTFVSEDGTEYSSQGRMITVISGKKYFVK